jgi:serine/threonine protein kinase
MTDELDRVKAALSERYAIERELGSGGMATVYLAGDLKHERQVAIKVLRPDLAAAVGSVRFLREIRITARLNHPHILSLIDSGEADGLLYYVMPYVSGGSLRRQLGGSATIRLDIAVHIAGQVASALDHAHRQGVIHRDVKPENILFSEGHAIVADFGIAKAVSSVGRESLTRTGVPLGTPGYMSPEQTTAIMELDERTDVYGLGCVVYEMLVGETPGLWPTEEALRLGRFVDATPEHRERLDGLPGRVEQALVKALAVRPADRFQGPGEFADALIAATDSNARFSESELREIIGRAAELEAQTPTRGSALSIGGVEQVAAEVGIPPERVREAIAELEGRSRSPSVQRPPPPVVVQQPKKLKVERTVHREVPESAYVTMVDEIRATIRETGHVNLFFAGSLVWSTSASGEVGRNIYITITPQAGRTHIRIEENLELTGSKVLAPIFGSIGGGLLGITLSVFLGGSDWAMIIPAGLLAFWGGYLSANTIIRNDAARRRPQLEGLADRLAVLAEQAGAARDSSIRALEGPAAADELPGQAR